MPGFFVAGKLSHSYPQKEMEIVLYRQNNVFIYKNAMGFQYFLLK